MSDLKGHTAKFCLSVKDGEAKGEIMGSPATIVNLLVNICRDQKEILAMITAAAAIAHKLEAGESIDDLNIDDLML